MLRDIWNKALPYQDTRDDVGHAKTVMQNAYKLLKYEKGEDEIVIPASILHDIGWAKIKKQLKSRFLILNYLY